MIKNEKQAFTFDFIQICGLLYLNHNMTCVTTCVDIIRFMSLSEFYSRAYIQDICDCIYIV